MIDTGLSLFHEGYRIGGATKPERFKAMAAVCRNPDDNRKLMEEWFAHPTYDDYWADEDCTRFFDKMNVPCFTIGSWYDFMCTGSVQSFVGRQHHGGPRGRGRQQLLLGPWLHGRFKETNRAGELEYPENAKFAMENHMLRWFDHYFKGIDNGVEARADRSLLRDGRRGRARCAGQRVAHGRRLADPNRAARPITCTAAGSLRKHRRRSPTPAPRPEPRGFPIRCTR